MGVGDGAERDLAFVSYCHEDREWLERLQILLKPYVRAGQLQVWADPYIQVGGDWRREIDQALGRTCVGVLLVSHHCRERALPGLSMGFRSYHRISWQGARRPSG